MTGTAAGNGGQRRPKDFSLESRQSIPVGNPDNGGGMAVPEAVLLDAVAATGKRYPCPGEPQQGNHGLLVKEAD